MNKLQYIGLFSAAAVLLFIFNGQLLITDPVESNYVQTAKEMVLSGNWLEPQIFGQVWFDKPIMFYWLTALGYKLFGFNEFAARFFPSLFGIFSLLLLVWGGRRLFNNRAGGLAGWILLSTIEYFLIAKSIITDMVLFFFFNGGLLFFILGYKEQQSRFYYLMYAFFGAAVLTKGPVGIVLPMLIIGLFLLLERNLAELRRLKLLTGLALFSLVGLSWYGYMTYLYGWDFLNGFLGIHNVLRATVSEHPRDNVIYYYLLVTILGLFPWSSLLPSLVHQELRGGWRNISAVNKFLLLWCVVIFVFFQCMATKYITYTFPLLFPAALLIGAYLQARPTPPTGALLFNMVFYGLLAGGIWYCVENAVFVPEQSMTFLFIVLAGAALLPLAAKWLRGGRYCVTVMTLAALAFNIALLDNVAVSLAKDASSREIVRQTAAQTTDTLYVYGTYPVSAAFYDDAKYILLVPAAELEGFKPKKFDWSSKHIMPFTALEPALEQQNVRVLLRRNRLDRLQKVSGCAWQELDAVGSWLIVQRQE